MVFKAQIESCTFEPAAERGGSKYPEAYRLNIADKSRGARVDKFIVVKITPAEHAALLADHKKVSKSATDLQDVPCTCAITSINAFSGTPFLRGQVSYGHEFYDAYVKAA